MNASFPSKPALAYGGGVYLMAWVDERLDVDSQVADVFAARFSETGSPLDSTPIAVGTALQNETHPSVAFDGTNFLVTWSRYRVPPYNGGGDTVGARVTPDGRVIEENPIVILRDGFEAAVVSRSPGWIVAGADTHDSSMLRFADVDTDGAVHSARTLIGPSDSYGRMAAGGGTLLTVGRSNAALIDLQTNTLTALNFGLLQKISTISSVAWGGDAYYVTWPTGTSVSLTRVTTTGEMTPVSLPAAAGYGSAVTVKDGTLLVAYVSSKAEVMAQVVSLPGMQGGTELVLAPEQTLSGWDIGPAVASGQSGFAVAWNGNSSTNASRGTPKLAIVGGSDGGAGAAEAPRGSSDELTPAVAADDRGFSLVWTEQSDAGPEILLMRFDALGNPRDAAPVDIGKGRNPAVARRAGRTMIFWEEDSYVPGARIDDSETVPHLRERLDGSAPSSPFGITSFSSPALASTSDGFVLATSMQTDTPAMISASRFDPEWPDTQMSPRVGIGAGFRSRLAQVEDTFAACVGVPTMDTQATGAISFGIVNLASRVVTSTDGAEPSIAYGAGRLLVAYRHGSKDATKTIRVKVFDAMTGDVVGPAASDLNTNAQHCDRPSVAFDGNNFWVAFRRVDGSQADIFGARVAPSGEVLDPTAFPVSMDPEVELAPALAANTAGRVFIAYSRFDRTSGGARLKIRWAE